MGTLSAINSTALWTASLRAKETTRDSGLINDQFAHKFAVNADILKHFEGLEKPSKSIIARCHFIDNYLIEALIHHENRQIVSIGAGFCCRPYRIKGGIWYEIDQKPLIEMKNTILSSDECPNSLARIGIDATNTDLSDFLVSLNLHNPIIVLEGLLNYLEDGEVDVLLNNIKKSTNNPIIIGDVMSRHFYYRYAADFRRSLGSLGLDYKFLQNDPKRYFSNLGWKTQSQYSVLDLAITAGLFKIPKLVKLLFMQKLISGYQLYLLQPSEHFRGQIP